MIDYRYYNINVLSHLTIHPPVSSSSPLDTSLLRMMMMFRLIMTVVILPTTLALVEGTTRWTTSVRDMKTRATDFVIGTKYKLKSSAHSAS